MIIDDIKVNPVAYPQPATPLPWALGVPYGAVNQKYAIHAANSFPHLVAALEEIWADGPNWASLKTEKALAIARGEVKP